MDRASLPPPQSGRAVNLGRILQWMALGLSGSPSALDRMFDRIERTE